MLDVYQLHLAWFISGLGIGMVLMMVIWVISAFITDVRHQKEIKEAKEKGYSRGRKFKDRQIEYFEISIDELWYEIEELRKRVSNFEQTGAS